MITHRGSARKLAALAGCLAASTLGAAAFGDVGPITFQVADYDNTANTVLPGPTPQNNQTTGSFRDLFWWRINNGEPFPTSPDFINRGNALILQGISAVPGPGPLQALNFTGPAVSSNPGHQTYATIYDTTPADGTATRNLFDASTGGFTISTDVMLIKHAVSGGLLVAYDEGEYGLAFMATNGDGNNPDALRLSIVSKSQGSGIQLENVVLPSTSFVSGNWYRLTMEVTVTGDTWTVDGSAQNHVDPLDPFSGLGSTIAVLAKSGSLSDPDGVATALVLSNPGEIGLVVVANESIALPDNVGVSFTNFGEECCGGNIPEPASLSLLALGLAGLVSRKRRR